MHPFLLSFNIGGICMENYSFCLVIYKYLFFIRIRMIYNYNTTCPIWILSFDLSQTRILHFLLPHAAKNEGIVSNRFIRQRSNHDRTYLHERHGIISNYHSCPPLPDLGDNMPSVVAMKMARCPLVSGAFAGVDEPRVVRFHDSSMDRISLRRLTRIQRG